MMKKEGTSTVRALPLTRPAHRPKGRRKGCKRATTPPVDTSTCTRNKEEIPIVLRLGVSICEADFQRLGKLQNGMLA